MKRWGFQNEFERGCGLNRSLGPIENTSEREYPWGDPLCSNGGDPSCSNVDHLFGVKDSEDLIPFVIKDPEYSYSWKNHIHGRIDSYFQSQSCIDTTSGSDNDRDIQGSVSGCGGESSNSSEGESSSIRTFTKDLDRTQKYKHLWVHCEECDFLNYKRLLKTKMNICEQCGYHLKMSSSDRIELLIDPGTWDPLDEDMVSLDPIKFDSEEEAINDPVQKLILYLEKLDPSKMEEYYLDPIRFEEYYPEFDSDREDNPEYKKAIELLQSLLKKPDPEDNPESDSDKDKELLQSLEAATIQSPLKKPDPSKMEEYYPEFDSDGEELSLSNEEFIKELVQKLILYLKKFKLKKLDPSKMEDYYPEVDSGEEAYQSQDPIQVDSGEEEQDYKDRIDSYQIKTGLTEAVQTGLGQLNGIPVAIGVMDFEFMGGSMGSVVGEKITRLIEHATNNLLPLIIVCASGGARMQEGSLSLMQMAKISSALYEYQSNKGLFYVSILTSPTTGGVTASFGMLGDIIIVEPNAYVAFAGKRVIEQTLNQTVPEGSQEAEYLFEKGLFDLIVPRTLLKSVLSDLFKLHGLNQNSN
jgi:acetyl-CoA carboxylase carboxyl transferase beta subunit